LARAPNSSGNWAITSSNSPKLTASSTVWNTALTPLRASPGATWARWATRRMNSSRSNCSASSGADARRSPRPGRGLGARGAPGKELVEVELFGSLRGRRQGVLQLVRQLRGEVTRLAAGDPLAEGPQRRPGDGVGLVAGQRGAFGHLREELRKLHGDRPLRESFRYRIRAATHGVAALTSQP